MKRNENGADPNCPVCHGTGWDGDGYTLSCVGCSPSIMDLHVDKTCNRERDVNMVLQTKEESPKNMNNNTTGHEESSLIITNKSTLNEIADIVHQNAINHGFHDYTQTERQFLNEQVLNLIREATELHEAWRSGNLHSICDKGLQMTELGLRPLTYAEEEYADIVIRALDQCRRLHINITEAIAIKHAYNLTRPHMHGGKLS